MRLESKVALITGGYGGMGRDLPGCLLKRAQPSSLLAVTTSAAMRWLRRSTAPEARRTSSNWMWSSDITSVNA
jgi:hypothetical protein